MYIYVYKLIFFIDLDSNYSHRPKFLSASVCYVHV